MLRAPPSFDRIRALFRAWDARHGAASPEVTAMLEAVLTRFALDAPRFSDVFEMSASWSADGASLRRFSYAFPQFRSDPEGATRALVAMAAPFGASFSDAAARVARAARHRAVAQPLFGFADDGARGQRIKLYLQFVDGRTVLAAELAQAVTKIDVDPARLDGRLHLIGLDLGGHGLRGVKLYVEPARAVDVAPLGPLARVLWVHRIDDPSADLPAPTELDFGMAENGLDPAAVLAALEPEYPEALGEFGALAATVPLRVRRVSLGLAPLRKLTLYYVIAE